ncbi:BnaA01g23030D [Brassica napus]|uniref:BnaA01g23030D protein n=1 Tax=Brassica napus TaxID=3708 RepID=A0A078I8J4_BRANA|nr:BnaA01g23030D [Brassica napus]
MGDRDGFDERSDFSGERDDFSDEQDSFSGEQSGVSGSLGIAVVGDGRDDADGGSDRRADVIDILRKIKQESVAASLADSLDAFGDPCGYVKKKKTRVRKARERPRSFIGPLVNHPDPSESFPSIVDDDTIKWISANCCHNGVIEARIPGEDERPWTVPDGWPCIYDFWITEYHLWFPLPRLLLAYCDDHLIALAQLTPAAIQNIVVALFTAADIGVHMSLCLFERIADITRCDKTVRVFYVSMKTGCGVVGERKRKTLCWIKKFFYVRIAPSSVHDVSDMIAPFRTVSESTSHFTSRSQVTRRTPLKLLPKTLFKQGMETQVEKVNNTCRTSILKKVEKYVEAEYKEVLGDPLFAQVMAIYVHKLKYSGRVIHSFVCKQLLTAKRHELWFHFARRALRFSMQEFHAITGLKYKDDEPDLDIDNWRGDKGFWSKLLRRKGKISLQQIRKVHLKSCNTWSHVDRLRMVYLCVIAGLVMAKDEKVSIPHKYIKLVMDFDKMRKFMWVLHSFDATSITETRDKVKTRNSYVIDGFSYALQIWLMEAIPDIGSLLGEKLREGVTSMRCRNWKGSAKFYYEDIISIETDFASTGFVFPYISSTGNGNIIVDAGFERDDEMNNERVDLINDMNRKKYDWSKHVWGYQETVQPYAYSSEEDGSKEEEAGETILQIGTSKFDAELASRIMGPNEWLKNYDMDAMMYLFRKKTSLRRWKPNRVAFMNCMFSNQIITAYGKFDGNRRVYKVDNNLLEYGRGELPYHGSTGSVWSVDVDCLYIPICVNQIHWISMCVNLVNRTIEVFDCGGKKNNRAVEAFAILIPRIVKAVQSSDKKKDFNVKQYTVSYVPMRSLNKSGNDCGAYSLKFIECHLLGLDFSLVNDENIQEARHKIAFDLWEAANDEALQYRMSTFKPPKRAPKKTVELF